ncbi:MAG: LytTR family DNA-binding domain-containing protein [Bacteroidota bacterium]
MLKPIDIDELLRAVRKIQPRKSSNGIDERLTQLLATAEQGEYEKIALSSAEGLHFIELKDIVRLESAANYTSFHLHSGERITVARTIKNFETLLPSTDFFRSHQLHIVNLAHVKRIERKDGGYLLMEDDEQVPIARSKKEELMGIVKMRFLQ